MTNQNEPKPVLELSTLAPDRPFIDLKSTVHPEGKHYELADARDLSLEDSAKLKARGDIIDKLMKRADKITQKDAKQLDLIFSEIAGIVLPGLEDEVRDELRTIPKLQIMMAFTNASPDPKDWTEAQMTQMTPRQPTSAS